MLLATLTWRLFATADTFLISVLVTKNLKLAGSIVGIEVATKMIWYLLHERAWAQLSQGADRQTIRSFGEAPPRSGFGAVGVQCVPVPVRATSRSSRSGARSG
jgi:uncharacterized membrane protein